jgi:hypothetical protein
MLKYTVIHKYLLCHSYSWLRGRHLWVAAAKRFAATSKVKSIHCIYLLKQSINVRIRMSLFDRHVASV